LAFSTDDVTDEQLHAMWLACSEISSQPEARLACRRLSERLSAIIDAPTVVFRRDVSPWKLVVSSPGVTPRDEPGDIGPLAGQLEELMTSHDTTYLPVTGHHQQLWTPLGLDEEHQSQVLLLLPGDWRHERTAPWLSRFARTASLALRLVATRQSARQGERLATDACSFARNLGLAPSGRVLYQLIVDAAAKTANARLGGLSIYRPEEAAITVTATHGYPSEAVDSVRIVPGSGIIGGVFSSKKPVLVRDTTRVPGLSPRSRRYQTASFMALPIVAGEDALGVITLADRHDGRPFTRSDLSATRVITALASLALVREQLTRVRDELAHAAAVDSLTGMFNRRYLQSRLDAELERSRRSGAPVALLMLDVDTFKSINDQLGHPTGDAVLRKVSEIIRRSVRTSDVCTRYGGDEFSVIVSENADTAAQTAERIRHRVEAFRWETVGVPSTRGITISIGVCLADSGEGTDSLIARADQLMYEAKAHGRNRVHPPISDLPFLPEQSPVNR
jgi:diguanylate cyclase (GGDEF)-like protein